MKERGTGPAVVPGHARARRWAAAVFPASLLVAGGTLLMLSQSLPGGRFERADAERILRYLSDDAREGRGSFTAGGREAARFIASEFSSAGLVPADSSRSFLRPFRVFRSTPESLSVELNGRPVPDSECFIRTGSAGGRWALSDSFGVTAMADSFDRTLLSGGNGVVLVPRRHARMFRRYRSFAARPRVFDEPAEPGAVVAILTDSPDARSVVATYAADVDTPILENVVGTIPGRRKGEVVLFSAHYDHLGIVRPVDGDSIANGADDDASGATALILLARHFASLGPPERTLVFAAFAAEEIGGFGSRRLLAEIDPDSIVAMVNIEMVGKPSKFGRKSFWITGYERSSFGPIVSAQLEGTGYRAHADPYPSERLFFRSDNAVFALAGVPAHTVSTTPIDEDTLYHTVRDEFQTVDPANIAETAAGIAEGVRGLVSAAKTPSRIPKN